MDPMIATQQHKSEMPFNVLREPSGTAQFNSPDWRKTSADEASDLSEDVLISAAQAGQEWAFVELCFRYSKRILFMLYKITKTEKMPRTHCRSQDLRLLFILEISIELPPL